MTPYDKPPPFIQPPPLRPRIIEEPQQRGMSATTLILSVAAGILLAMFLACAGMTGLSFVLPFIAGNY
jgi:hypothetical protein